MNKKIKQLLKKHVAIVKSMYPEIYIEVTMTYENILIGIDSLDISNEERYVDLLYTFAKEYERKGFADIYWGVNSSLTNDDLAMLEDSVKTPVKKIAQKTRKESLTQRGKPQRLNK